MNAPPICLTIAGLDPSGGAGIIADIRTFSAFGCFPAAVVASLTFQNTVGVFGAEHQSGEVVRAQAEPVFEDYTVDAMKTGMLPTRDVIETCADLIRDNRMNRVVIDPVVRSTSGFDLIDDAALAAMIESLFPLAAVITPNIPEAERIAKMRVRSESEIARAGEIMLSMGASAVLIKGGHLAAEERSTVSVDHLFYDEGVERFRGDYIDTDATHGTGCTLAAAITANLALGKSLRESVAAAKEFVTEAIRTAPSIGRGHSPINIKPI